MTEASRPYAVGVTSDTVQKRLVAGAAAGLVGGLVFGMMMGMMGMLPLVAMLVGSQDATVGFIVHMVISAVIGIGFGLAFGGRTTTLGQGALWGVVYGIIWWVLGPLLIMPTLMGMGPQLAAAFTVPMMMSLVGHLVYGVVTGLAYRPLARRFG